MLTVESVTISDATTSVALYGALTAEGAVDIDSGGTIAINAAINTNSSASGTIAIDGDGTTTIAAAGNILAGGTGSAAAAERGTISAAAGTVH